MRSLATSLAVGVEVALILLIAGLASGMIRENGKRIAGIGADIVLQPPNSSLVLAASTGAMSVKIADLVSEIKGVSAVSPVYLQFNTSGGLGLIWGIDLESFNQISQGFVYLEGTGFQGPNEVMIDDIYARGNQLRLGDEMKLMSHSFLVRGIVENGKGSRVFIPIGTMQELVGTPGKSTMMLIKCQTLSDIPNVKAELERRLKSYPAFDMSEFTSQIVAANRDFGPLQYFTRTVVFLATLIGFFIIFLSMYTAITERTHEIGILKSLGATKPYLLFLFLKEALLLGGFGFLLGLGLTLGGRVIFKFVFPTLHHYLSPEWLLLTGTLALLSASLGALYPAWRAASQDPIEALAYE
jgi:putative ABC transport system permease protein